MMATTIPGKQLVWAGSYDALRTNLHAREIGLCTDDLVLYVKYGQELIPCGYCEGGVGISVDGHKINLTERSTYQAYPATIPAVQGALKITQNNVGNNGVRIGDMGSDIGQLAPNVPADSIGKALYIGANGRLEWGVVGTSVDSPDESVQIESEIVANQKVYHIMLPDLVSPGSYVKVEVDSKGRIVGGGVLESSDIPDGIIGKEKLNLEDMMPVIAGDGIEIQDISGLLLFSVADDSLTSEKFSNALKLQTVKDYVTPEMFGAAGDGVTDDTEAFEAAIATQEEVRLKGTYLIRHALDIPLGKRLIGFNNAQIRISTDSACILNITGGKVTLRGFGVYANGHSVDCGIVCDVESSRFLFEKVIVDHCTSGIKMRSYLTKLIGCEVSYFTENGFEFIGVNSEEYNSNTSIVLINCYARKDTNVRAKIGYKLTDVIYCSLVSCACDHCEVAYEMQRCQSIAMLGCGCENVSDSAVKLREICRGITINSLFAGLSNAHSIVRCYGTNYLSVGECYWNVAGTLDYVFYGGGHVVVTLPEIWRPHNIYVYKTSKVSFANKVTYEPDSAPTKVYDGDMYTKDGRVFFAEKNTTSNNYAFQWRELDKAANQLSGGFSGKNRVVFALAEIVDGSVLNFTDGKLLLFNASGNADLMAEINFGFVRNGTSTTSGRFFCYGSYQEIEGTVTLDGTEQLSDYVGFRPVAFTGYNSKKYVGIEFYCGNLTNPSCFIKSDISRGILPYLIEWYDQSTHTVKNSTVANSIVTLPNKIPMTVDRAKRDVNGNEIRMPAMMPSSGIYTMKIVDGVVQWVQDAS